MKEKLKQLLQLIDVATKAPILKKARAVEEAVKAAAHLSSDLVNAYEDQQQQIDALTNRVNVLESGIPVSSVEGDE